MITRTKNATNNDALHTKNMILRAAIDLAVKHDWSLTETLSILQDKLGTGGRYYESNPARELLADLIPTPSYARFLSAKQ
jgi:hypothetical protein